MALLALFPTTAFSQEDGRHRELPNFHKVNDGLYRGGQPKIGGLERLKQLGIKTVINLRDDDSRAKQEEVGAQRAGLQYFNIPFERLGRPRNEDNGSGPVNNQQPCQPTCIRPLPGWSRPHGMVIAVYRITHDGWTSQEARSEAKRYGLKPWQIRMKRYIGDFYKRQIESAKRNHD